MKERKQCFDKFVRSRADEERKERKVKLKEKKDNFRKLMEEIVNSERYYLYCEIRFLAIMCIIDFFIYSY